MEDFPFEKADGFGLKTIAKKEGTIFTFNENDFIADEYFVVNDQTENGQLRLKIIKKVEEEGLNDN